MKIKIYLATDHAGFQHKNIVRELLEREFADTYEVVDCGAFKHNPTDDYPDFIKKAAQAVSANPDNAKAIIFGGSGQGEAMVANKYSGVRATVYYGSETEIIKLSREHNDANVLSIGARFVAQDLVEELVRLWLATDFSKEERHIRRINKFKSISAVRPKGLLNKLFNTL